MTKDDIITLPNPHLHQKSKRIAQIDDQVHKLAKDMIAATLDWEDGREHEIGVALAAVQVDKLYRLIVVRKQFKDKNDGNFRVFINPEIVKAEGEPVESMEGCLSVPELYGKVKRYPKIKLKALNLEGKSIRTSATGFVARVLQHEIDHTNGLLFVDRVEEPSNLFHLEPDGKFTPLKHEHTT